MLAGDEPRAYRIVKGAGQYPCLLVCDHASHRIPTRLGDLGLDIAARRAHLAWDIGTAKLTLALNRRLGFTAVLCEYSRLVVDCNRSLEDPTAFIQHIDGITVPGNIGLTPADEERRAEAIYWPYHTAIGRELDALEVGGSTAALFSVHSFTPVFEGKPRVWDAGVLWDKDARFAQPVLEGLSAGGAWRVGNNEPYSGRSPQDFTVDYHAEAHGRAHLALEIRQDHLGDAAGVARWADALTTIVEPILQSGDLFRPVCASDAHFVGQRESTTASE